MPTKIVIELDATPEEVEQGMRKLKNRDGGAIPPKPHNGSITYSWSKDDPEPSVWSLASMSGEQLFSLRMLSIRLG